MDIREVIMKFYIRSVSPEHVSVRARAESEDGGMVGDLFRDIKPEQSIFGYTFEELQELGPGEHEPKQEPKDD
jgi:hypothetical protein